MDELIVSHFHDKGDTGKDIPSALKNSKDYKDTEKVFNAGKQVAFLHQINERKLWERINKKINPRTIYLLWAKYAAIIVLSFALGSSLFYFSGISKYETKLASISSPRGQITSLTLFDGSTVWLNSGSTLQYASDFNTGKREVFVEGEAYFDVVKDKNRPFIVHLENSKVKVHGTSFNVKAYPGSGQVEAVLVEGKIEFIANDSSVLLSPNERVVLSPLNGKIVKERVDVEKASAWKKGKYYYSNEQLSIIVRQLQRWYDTEFVFDENELEQFTFTGVINREKSVQYNLKLIELTNKINVEFKNERIIITGK